MTKKHKSNPLYVSSIDISVTMNEAEYNGEDLGHNSDYYTTVTLKQIAEYGGKCDINVAKAFIESIVEKVQT